MCVLTAMINEWFHYGILRLNRCVRVDQTLKFVAVAHLWEVDWNGFGSPDWFPY